jgi:hypothetical protein
MSIAGRKFFEGGLAEFSLVPSATTNIELNRGLAISPVPRILVGEPAATLRSEQSADFRCVLHRHMQIPRRDAHVGVPGGISDFG